MSRDDRSLVDKNDSLFYGDDVGRDDDDDDETGKPNNAWAACTMPAFVAAALGVGVNASAEEQRRRFARVQVARADARCTGWSLSPDRQWALQELDLTEVSSVVVISSRHQ